MPTRNRSLNNGGSSLKYVLNVVEEIQFQLTGVENAEEVSSD
jgi:hypothetical protein